jgi:hypothetical protein
VSPYTYVISTDDTYYYASNAFQIIYGGPDDAGGVDGTNPQAVIQAAITASSTGESILIKVGTFVFNTAQLLTDTLGSDIHACLILKSGVHLIGESRAGTILKLGDGIVANIIGGWTANDATVENLTVDGNKVNQTTTNVDGEHNGIYFMGTGVKVVNVTAKDCVECGVYGAAGYRQIYENIYATNCDGAGFAMTSSSYSVAKNIYVYDCCKSATQTMNTAGVIFANNHHASVYGIKSSTNDKAGFYFRGGGGYGGSGDQVYENGFDELYSDNNGSIGFMFSAGVDAYIIAHHFGHLSSNTDGATGVYYYGLQKCVFDFIEVINCNQTNDATYKYGVSFSTCEDVVIKNLSVLDNQDVHTIYSPVKYVNANERIFILSGNFGDATDYTSSELFHYADDTGGKIIFTNINGINNQGFGMPQPAMVPSDTYEKNKYPFPVKIFMTTPINDQDVITSYTIMDVDGTAKSFIVSWDDEEQVGKQFTLQPQDQIKFTYTFGNPNWFWYGC